MSSSFELTVKSPDRLTYTVRVSPEWTIERVKEEVARVSNTPNLDIVFCGQRLENHKKLKDVGMQTTSTVHFVVPKGGIRPNIRQRTNLQSLPLASLPESLCEQASPGDTPGDLTHQFFVYCRRPCASLAPGKLRVRCATCKQGGFELHKDPAGWADVLEKGRLNGICHAHGCRGEVAEFFFKCASHETAEDDTCPPLPMFRQNTYNITCPICLEIRYLPHCSQLVVVFECPDHHCMCMDCFTEYCTTKLKDRQFVNNDKVGFTLSCPVPNHDQYVVSEIHHFRVMGDELYERYKDLSTEMFLLQSGGVFCPACKEGILPDQRRVQCRCGHVFCKNCRSNFHPGKCSDRPPSAAAVGEPGGRGRMLVDTQAFRQARWNEASEAYIKENAKLCPRCHANTEKNGGCNHITCTVCKHEWCWWCGNAWGRSCMNSHWFQE